MPALCDILAQENVAEVIKRQKEYLAHMDSVLPQEVFDLYEDIVELPERLLETFLYYFDFAVLTLDVLLGLNLFFIVRL